MSVRAVWSQTGKLWSSSETSVSKPVFVSHYLFLVCSFKHNFFPAHSLPLTFIYIYTYIFRNIFMASRRTKLQSQFYPPRTAGLLPHNGTGV